MTNIATRLSTLGIKVDDTFLDKWDVSELSSMLTQEESRLKKQGGHSINLIGQGAGKGLKVKANKFKKKRKHLLKFHRMLIRNLRLICVVSGFTTIQTTNPNKDFVFMGNRMKAQIEGIGTYRLILETGHHLDLLQTLYVPSVSRNLISLSRLDVSGFDFKKSQASSDALKVYVNEVERQLDRKVKIIRSDRGGKYYGKYNESEQCPGPFAKFLENDEVSGSVERQSVKINEVRVNISLPMNVPTSAPITNVIPLVEEHFNNVEQHLGETLQKGTNSQVSDANEPQIVPLRKSAISDDFVIYLQESDFDIGINKDPISFSQAIESTESNKWIDAIMKS
ncbi:hypothetical protein KY284_032786 [Solanum tuberosum]|nr:hypothetical protein KY284_032786 [Solanum tuberosum]